MADADSKLKNKQNVREPKRTPIPGKQFPTQIRLNKDIIDELPKTETAPLTFPLQQSSPLTTTTSIKIDDPIASNLNRYPSFTIRYSSIDQQDGEHVHSESYIDSDYVCKKLENVNEKESSGDQPSNFEPLLPATISQYEHDTNVKIKAILSSPLQPKISSTSSSNIQEVILDQQQNTINANKCTTKKINKCIIVNPVSLTSSSVFTSSVPSEQILNSTRMHPPTTMTIPSQIHSSNTSTSTLITKPSSSTSLDQTSPLSSLSVSLQNRIYQVPSYQPPLKHHPTIEHSHHISSQQSLSTPSSLSSSKINLNDTTPSDFLPGIFLDNKSNILQKGEITGGSTSPIDVTSSLSNVRENIINYDENSSSSFGVGTSNMGEAIKQFQSTNPFYNCDTKFKRDEFLKATMRICLVVSPPTNKLQVNA